MGSAVKWQNLKGMPCAIMSRQQGTWHPRPAERSPASGSPPRRKCAAGEAYGAVRGKFESDIRSILEQWDGMSGFSG